VKLLIALAAVALALGACSGDDGDGLSVTGTVTAPAEAPDAAALPAGATLTVTLQDISRADAAAVILSNQVIELSDTEFPVAFELPYQLGDIAEANTSSIAARAESGGDLLMISDTVVPVITNGAPTTGVEVALVSIAAN
jgi:putative lipoprotein